MSKAERRPSQQSSKDKIEQARQGEMALSAAYYRMSMTQEGQAVLQDLANKFNVRTTIRKSGPADNKTVDPYASIAAAGGAEVIIYIGSRVRHGNPTPQLKDVSDG